MLSDDEIPERLRELDFYVRVEAALLARALMDEKAMLKAIKEGITDAHFSHELLRRAWVAARSLHSKGIPCDMHSIRAELRTINPEDDTLFAEIATMFESPGYNAHVKHYARILRFRAAERMAWSVCKLPESWDSIDDFAAEVVHTGQTMVQIAGSILDDGSESERSVWDKMDEEMQASSEGCLGVMTGLKDVDSLLGGMRPTEYVIVGARPGIGKSSFAVTTCVNMLKANPGARIFYASPEMGTVEVLKRLVSAMSRISTKKFETRGLLPVERDKWLDARQTLEAANLRVANKGMHDPQMVRAEAVRLAGEWGGIDLVIVDHLHVMRGEGKTPNERMTSISSVMQRLAHELNAPVMALAQLSRSLESREDKTPQLHDLRDSGSLEQDANAVLMLHRDVTKKPADFKHEMDVFAQKVRRGDPGTAKVTFCADLTLMEDYWPKSAETWNG